MTSRHTLFVADGFTQASNVIAVVRCNAAASGMLTRALVPLNDSAPPDLPAVVQVAPEIVPVRLLGELSPTVVPLPSLNPQAPTRPLADGAPGATETAAEALVLAPSLSVTLTVTV